MAIGVVDVPCPGNGAGMVEVTRETGGKTGAGAAPPPAGTLEVLGGVFGTRFGAGGATTVVDGVEDTCSGALGIVIAPGACSVLEGTIGVVEDGAVFAALKDGKIRAMTIAPTTMPPIRIAMSGWI